MTRNRRENNAVTWNFGRGVKVGRLRASLVIHKHTYGASSDRWVFQPSIVFDRKKKSTFIRDPNRCW